MTDVCDFLVIGAGMAGASAAYFLAGHGRVTVLEMESQPGYHTTGRSAALFTEAYGNRTIRAITKATRPFLESPPDGFAAHPILTPRGDLLVAREDQLGLLDRAFAEIRELMPGARRLDAAETLALAPVLRPGYAAGGLYGPDAMDIDVHALHQGFLKGLRQRGGRLVADAPATALRRSGTGWEVTTPAGRFAAGVVVNAAGAWCDHVAALAAVPPVGLVPKRRTAFTFDAPAGFDPGPLPAVIDIEESWYIKPEAGRFLGSPADETPSEPCDAQPEELDLAIAVDRIEQATTMTIRRFHSKWAGLRSFVKDKTPVAGFAPGAPGFFWLAGQGGYGIQTSAGMGRIAAALATGGDLPADIAALGVAAAHLSPDRPGLNG